MPLNANAPEWKPSTTGISKQLAKIKLVKSETNNSSNKPRHLHTEDTTVPLTTPSSSSDGDEFDQTIEEELQFEEMFDRAPSGHNSAHSTPRTSLVGPSPLPSASASPQTRGPLLTLAEASATVAAAASILSSSFPNSTSPAALAALAAAAAAAAPPPPPPQPEQGGAHREENKGNNYEESHQQEEQETTTTTAPEEEEERNGVDSPAGELVIEMPTVITHVETAASAAAAAIHHRRLGPNDFELLRVVGQGAFGKVFQVRKRDTCEVFAMKVMRKDRILERRHGEYVKAERDALTAVVHPYIVTLRYSFQTPTKLYLVLDFINGGHLFFQLYRAGTFDEPLARLYTAELVLAVTHLHSLGFVHRDLKPENVLLDAQGHVRVTDFGLAKGNMSDADDQRTNSFIGTMEYMAPEVIAGRGHGKAVDWWSVGVLLYEMLCGVPPFRAKSRPALQKLITSAKVKIPGYLSSDAANLLRGLLTKEASKRLGFGPAGSGDVMKHGFFKGVNWKKLEAREVPSPFRPTIRSIESVENFDKIWTDLPVLDSPCKTPVEGSGSLEAAYDYSAFEGFTYCAPSMMMAAGAALGTTDTDTAAATSAAATAAANAAKESSGDVQK